MSLTITLHAWWLLPYLAIGLVVWWPLLAYAGHHTSPRMTSVESIQQMVDWYGWFGLIGRFAIQVVCWPLSTWETLR